MKADINNHYQKHFVALSVLFILGNAVITAPQKNANQYNFLGFLVSGVIAIAVYFVCYFLPFNKIVAVLSSLLALFCIGRAGITFIRFIHIDLLPDTKPFLIVLPFIAVLIFIAFQNPQILLKFSLTSFVPSLAVILFFFFATAKDFNAKNIFIRELPDLNVFFGQLLPYLEGVVLPTALLTIFAKLSNMKKSTALCGFCLGYILLGITILNSVLLFGIEFSGRLDFPYASAGSTVTFGNLFTRMDGFLYFVYLVSCIVKCAVGIFVIKKSRNILVP